MSNPLRLNELVDTSDPAWPLVSQVLLNAGNNVQIQPAAAEQAARSLVELQVTTRSPLGSIVYNTGGVLIDFGWVRLLGSGSKRISDTPTDWYNRIPPSLMLVVAHDVLGGVFVLNGGAFDGRKGSTYYWDPGTLGWRDLKIGYSDFLNWLASGDISHFYDDLRWPTWVADISELPGHQAFHSYPFLWTSEGKNPERNSRKLMLVRELWDLQQAVASQVKDLTSGTKIDITTTQSG